MVDYNSIQLHKTIFLRSLSEATAKGGIVAMAERIFANAYMVLGVGAKIMFYIVANFSATIKAKWISFEWSPTTKNDTNVIIMILD